MDAAAVLLLLLLVVVKPPVAVLFSVLLQLLPLLIRRCILTADPLPLLMIVPDESDSLYLPPTPPAPVLGFNVADEDDDPEPEQR